MLHLNCKPHTISGVKKKMQPVENFLCLGLSLTLTDIGRFLTVFTDTGLLADNVGKTVGKQSNANFLSHLSPKPGSAPFSVLLMWPESHPDRGILERVLEPTTARHCEERSDEATPGQRLRLLRFARNDGPSSLPAVCGQPILRHALRAKEGWA